jgi:hypothetical protein
LRLVLLGTGCARCGQPFGDEGVRVLAQRDEIAFVQFVCSTCQTQTLALVTGLEALANQDEDAPVRAGEAAPISEQEVRDMRSFLADYHGDLRTLLDR